MCGQEPCWTPPDRCVCVCVCVRALRGWVHGSEGHQQMDTCSCHRSYKAVNLVCERTERRQLSLRDSVLSIHGKLTEPPHSPCPATHCQAWTEGRPCSLPGAQRAGKEQPGTHVWDVGPPALSGDAVRALPRPRSSASSQTCVTWLLESPGPRAPWHHVECCPLHVYCGAPYKVTGVEPCIKITGQNFSKCPVDI